MADQFGYSAMPGAGVASLTTERNAILGPITWYLLKGVVVNGAASSDAGNTPTTELRHGLLMGLRTSDGFAANYGPNATDGTQLVAGFLWEPRTTIDTDGNTVNRPAQIVIAGYVQASQLLLLDEQARGQMQGRFIFDDRVAYTPPEFFQTVAKTANYNVVASSQGVQGDSGTHFTTTGNAAAIVFTLPAVAKGNRFRFTNTVGQNMTVTGPANTLVTFNNAAATNVAFTTAGNLIGATVDVVADETGAKWIVMPRGANTMTVS